MNLSGKTVTVIGLGKSGTAAAKFLIAQKARVRASDGASGPGILKTASLLRRLGAQVETGGHHAAFAQGSDCVVTSPGVPRKNPILVYAKKMGIPVISEIELAAGFCRGRIVAVTGSNGKTTTCHLIHKLLKDAGLRSVLCGNVGTSFLDSLPRIRHGSWVVLELSSFQLEDSPTFRPSIAVVLNVSPNHLDRHGTLANYSKAKQRIFLNQKRGDAVVLNHDRPIVRAMARKARSKVVFFSKKPLRAGVYATTSAIEARKPGSAPRVLARRGRFGLTGEHNLENMLAASAVAWLAGLESKSIQRTLDHFHTLHHRIEPIGVVGGVRFVNDSKSTTVDSTRAAIEAVDGNLILVAGGRDKGAPFGEIEPLLLRRVKKAVLYGEARKKIAAGWRRFRRVASAEKFGDAVKLAFREASPGDTVLLSPMCTSFDQFSSYEHRGEAFRVAFRELGARWKR